MVDAMTQKAPEARISIARAVEMFEETRRALGRFALRRRLHPVDETGTRRAINDVYAFLYDGTYLLRRGIGRLLFKKSSSRKKQTAGPSLW